MEAYWYFVIAIAIFVVMGIFITYFKKLVENLKKNIYKNSILIVKQQHDIGKLERTEDELLTVLDHFKIVKVPNCKTIYQTQTINDKLIVLKYYDVRKLEYSIAQVSFLKEPDGLKLEAINCPIVDNGIINHIWEQNKRYKIMVPVSNEDYKQVDENNFSELFINARKVINTLAEAAINTKLSFLDKRK